MSVRYSDSGYYVVPVDRHPHSVDYMFENMNTTVTDKPVNCETELMCGYPIYSSRWLGWRYA